MTPAADDPRQAPPATARSIRGDVRGTAMLLADRIGGRAGVHAVFGEPVERDGVTVIPVGRVLWCVGGGEGRGADAGEEGEGSGGGGAVVAAPVGFIELSGGEATYRRIGSPVSPGSIIARAAALYLVMRGVRALLR